MATREEQIMSILIRRGHVSEATAFAELGRVQVASAIWRIKNHKPHLIPRDMEIVSVEKRDTHGKRYVEWRLEQTAETAEFA